MFTQITDDIPICAKKLNAWELFPVTKMAKADNMSFEDAKALFFQMVNSSDVITACKVALGNDYDNWLAIIRKQAIKSGNLKA